MIHINSEARVLFIDTHENYLKVIRAIFDFNNPEYFITAHCNNDVEQLLWIVEDVGPNIIFIDDNFVEHKNHLSKKDIKVFFITSSSSKSYLSKYEFEEIKKLIERTCVD